MIHVILYDGTTWEVVEAWEVAVSSRGLQVLRHRADQLGLRLMVSWGEAGA